MISSFLNKYVPMAKSYLQDKKKTDGLLKKSAAKALKNRGSLKSAWSQLNLLAEALKAWKNGEYPHFPTKSILLIIAAILYFVTPVDFIPDFIFGFGLIDDAAIIAFVIKQIGKELTDFRQWKEQQNGTDPETEK
ncbi:DUF1232 domain-containing protein [Metabacillus sp. GX 13764]|uniref:YkvA family protein n=1 Tax=Metabacillus kandeliae TaxID=2900151 RepID=UPI001E5B4C86|nr:YkvA family protein [Metabacillus kandeliae]MCD7036163.1 DUF1232 domain-containing protein [Metabacillus kandeliae]